MTSVGRYGFGLIACVTVGLANSADRFPERPVRFLVPYAAGGTTDIVGRIGGQELSKIWGQPVVIDNRLGAGGNIATDLVAKSTPDGYNLLVNTAAIVIAPNVYKSLPFDPIKDFVAISKLGSSAALVLVNPSLQVNTVSELVALAKAQPGKLNYGSSGTGTALHLATELFKIKAKVNMVHVPYKGSAPAWGDLMGGQIQVMMDALATALPLSKSGKVRGLAVTSIQRSSFAPDMPTVSESGVPGYEFNFWYGIFAPAATPRAIVEQINRDIVKAVAMPATRERFAANGVTPVGSTLAQFTAEVRSDLRTWADVAKAAGIKPQ